MSVVIIPAYKPDKTLIAITDQLWSYGCQMIVVDDGSGREYGQIFDKVADICIVLKHLKNRGKGAAIKTALDYITKEMWDSGMVGIMDCDGQHLPEDLLKLLASAGKHRKTLVLGVRSVGTKMPVRSRLGNQITRKAFKIATGKEVSDTQTGLRAFDPELIPRLLSVEGERYEYEMNMLMTCVKEKIPIHEVPVSTIYRDKNNSNSHFRSFMDSIRIYKDILKYTIFHFHSFKDSVRNYKDILKFTLSSFSSFVLDYLLFTLFMVLMPHTAVYVLLANIAARTASAFYNYSMNCRFVFHTNKRISIAVHYFALACFILIMNNLILEMLVQLMHVSVYPAKLMTECILFVLSWLIQSGVIFRKEKRLLTNEPAGGKAGV